MATEQAPWPHAITIDTSGREPPGRAATAAVRRALEAIRPHRPEHLWRPVRPYMLPD